MVSRRDKHLVPMPDDIEASFSTYSTTEKRHSKLVSQQ